MIKKTICIGLIIVFVLAIINCLNVFYVSKYYQYPNMSSLRQTFLEVAILNFIILAAFLWLFDMYLAESKTQHRALKFTSGSTILTAIFGFMVISNFTIYKDSFVSSAYQKLNNSILINNQGKQPQTELYSKFKSDWANNNFEAYKNYEKNKSELISINASDALLFKLAESSLKDQNLILKAKEISKDGFVSQKEFDEFKNEVLNTSPADRLIAIAMRNK